MISDEAVEAAALGIHSCGGVSVAEARVYARAALDFAAPHLMAQALNDAAVIFQGRLPDGTGNGRAYNSYQVADMLRARSAALEAPRGGD